MSNSGLFSFEPAESFSRIKEKFKNIKRSQVSTE